MTDKPTQKEMDDLFVEETGFDPEDFPAAIFGFTRAALAKWGAPHGQAPAKPDPANSAACNLATALFKKHFAHLPDFASGQAVWSLCDSTAGVISQIDNMVAGLVRPHATSPQADSGVQDDAARESEYRRGYRHGYEQRDAEVLGAMA